MSTLTSFKNSYIITARGSPSATFYANIAQLPDNELLFYTAPDQYEPDASKYTPVGAASQSPPQAYVDLLTADLKIAVANGFPQVTVMIHGLGTLFNDAVTEMTTLGNGLQQYANYCGLVISFDWPSYGELDSSIYYSSTPYAFPPNKASALFATTSMGRSAHLRTSLRC